MEDWEDEAHAHAHAAYGRACVDQATFVAQLPTAHAIDASWALRRITAPTLVMTRREAPQLGPEMARALAGRIPGAELVVLEGTAVAPFAGDSAAVVHAVHAALAGQALVLTASSSTNAAPTRLTSRELEALVRGRVEAAAYAYARGLALPGGAQSTYLVAGRLLSTCKSSANVHSLQDGRPPPTDYAGVEVMHSVCGRRGMGTEPGAIWVPVRTTQSARRPTVDAGVRHARP